MSSNNKIHTIQLKIPKHTVNINDLYGPSYYAYNWYTDGEVSTSETAQVFEADIYDADIYY